MKAARPLQYSRDDSTAFLGRAPTEKDAGLLNAYASLSIARAIDSQTANHSYELNAIFESLTLIAQRLADVCEALESKNF